MIAVADNKAFFLRRNVLLTLILLGLGAWLVFESGTALDSSHAWLMIAAMRLLHGGHAATDFFDPNPPLSVVAYLPPALMTLWPGIPIWYAPYVWGFVCLVTSAAAVRAVLARWPVLDADGRTAILFAYLIANTILTASTYFYFGEREQIVTLGLFPFLLVQLSMTWRVELPRKLLWPTLMLGAVAILIKPQYGVLPVLALLHRAMVQKRFSSLLIDADVIALVAAVVSYAALLTIVFPDYLTTVLPVFLRCYLPMHNRDAIYIGFLYAVLFFCVLLTTLMSGVPFARMRLVLLPMLAAGLCLGLFVMQMKGIYYQLLPALTFLFIGLGMLGHEILREYASPRPWHAPTLVAALCLAAFALHGKGVTALRHDAERGTPLAKLVETCAPRCGYLIFGEDIEKVSEIGVYTGASYVSRFPMLWWLPALYDSLARNPHDAQALAMKTELTRDVGEDLARDKPEVIAVITTLTMADGRPFDIVGFLSADPLFRREMQGYEKTGVLRDNRNNYFARPSRADDVSIDYDIYRRRP